MFEKLVTFLKEVRVELKKVTWPTKNETTRFTLMVMVVSLAIAAFLGTLDIIFQWILNTFIL